MAITPKKTEKKAAQKELPGTRVVEEEIEYMCPVRGLVKQKVKVKKLLPAEVPEMSEYLLSKSFTEELDRKYSGLLLDEVAAVEEEKDAT